MTPGSVVSLTIKLRITPPGKPVVEPINHVVPTGEESVEGAESTIDELIGRRKAGEDGEEPTPLAHAPHFPKVRLSLLRTAP